MSQITYSFVIPHKNCPDLLTRCVSSIPQRDDIQIIIVDDNSDIDKLPQLSRQDAEIIYLTPEQSHGAGHARNIGMSKAVGQWFLFADADDFYSPGFIDILDRYKDTTYDVVFFNFNLENGDLMKTEEKKHWEDVSEKTRQHDDTYLKYRFHVPWNKMVSRNLIVRNDIRFETTPIGNDIQFSIETSFMSRKYAIAEQAIYNYYIHDKSLSFGYRDTGKLMFLIEGWYKVNAFNDYIHHPEWNVNILIGLMFLMWNNKRRAPLILLRYLTRIPHFIRIKDKYVNHINTLLIS